jgi:hypothetical protein
MTLPSEVLRIFAKDVRVLRWPLAVWATLLAISTTRGLGVLQTLRDALYPFAILLPITAAIIIALAVAADPAVSGPTFWGVHRQRRTAVASAKGLLAMLLLACMAASHSLVLSSHGLTAQQLIVLVARAALETGAWFLFAAALAACARDAKGVLTGGALVGIIAFLLSTIAADHTAAMARWPLSRATGAALLAVVSVGVMAWTYRAHLTGMPARARTAALLVIAACVLITPRDSMARPVDGRTLERDAALHIDSSRTTARVEQRGVFVDVPVTYPDSSIVVAATTSWRLHLRDGSVIDLWTRGVRVRRTAKLLQPDESLASWGRGAAQRVLQFRNPLDSATLARVEGNLMRVSLAMETDRLTMHRRGAFASRDGGTVAHDGVRLRLEPVAADGRFATSVSYVRVPAFTERLPWTVAYANVPLLAWLPPDGSPARYLKAAEPRDGDSGMRSGSWVLPGNDMQGFPAALMPSDGTPAVGGTVVAIAADYAGRVTLPISAPARP